jgi:multidrug efflux pump
VIISSFAALTLTPMLSVQAAAASASATPGSTARRSRSSSAQRRYRRSLAGLLTGAGSPSRSWRGGGLSYLMWNALPAELAPLEDRGTVRVFATGPEGATFEYMEAYMNRMVDVIGRRFPSSRRSSRSPRRASARPAR